MVEHVPERMSLNRFVELTDAFGGRISTWPEECREAGNAFAATERGQAILSAATGLDALLDAYAVPPPSAALQGRILDATSRTAGLHSRFLRWWEGLGLVGVGVAGIVAGVMVMSVELSGPPEGSGFYDQPSTVFGDVGKLTDPMQEAQ